MRIKNLKLANNDQLEFGDFNVFIGGNGVGKTTFLMELYARITDGGVNKERWKIGNPEYETTDMHRDMVLLKNSLTSKRDQNTLFYYSQSTKDINGNTEIRDPLRFTSEELKRIETYTEPEMFKDLRIRRPFIALSSCESRLSLGDNVNIVGLDQPASDSINVLNRDKNLFISMDKTIFERFGIHFILLDHTRTQLFLGLSKENPPAFDNNADNLQDEYEKIQKWKNNKFIPITESGHGRRSMIRLLTNLLDPVNQVIMIDEPEMHLYPTHKRWLGQQLVKLATTQGKQVFLVTHDPIILQGILDANIKTSIFRVDREEEAEGKIKTCQLERLIDTNAMRNQDQYLQGLFYQRCIVVEGASDRSFYQNIFEEYEETTDKDLGFVAAGGKDSSKHMANIVKKIGLNASFIYDFDVLLDTPFYSYIYNLFGGSTDIFSRLAQIIKQIEQRPEISKITDPKSKQSKLKSFIKKVGKEGLKNLWVQENIALFNEALTEMAKLGVFIVPNGTLESWAPTVEEKYRFAESAPKIVQNNEVLKKSLRDFARGVLSFVKITLK